MKLSIRHHTAYRYETPAEYAAQILRMTPRPYDGLSILSWRIITKGPGRLSTFEDGFGNASHMHTVAQVHDAVEVLVEGVVETEDTGGVVRAGYETLPVGAYLRSTPLTLPSDAIRELATAACAASTAETLLNLMHLVRERVDYQKGSTHVMTTAADALAGGSGVCQDHTHVFLAAARSLRIPARYIGGYLLLDREPAAGAETILPVADDAGHAWAEAWDGQGWTAFDAANDMIPGECYVRTSVGLDYSSAAPVRGVRRDRGGVRGGETLEVDVEVVQMAQQ